MIAWPSTFRAADPADDRTPIDRLIRALPTHGWHLRAEAMKLLAGIVTEARPRLILELGSGSSTALLALQCRIAGGDARVVSIEESPFFAARTKRLLRRHSLLDRVSLLVSPIVGTRIGSWCGYCYQMSEAAIAAAMAGERADFVLIDGPMSAWTRRGDCRYGTLPLIRRWLADRALVIVDDAHRRRERDIIARWTAEHLFELLRSYAVGDGISVGRAL